MTTIPIAVGVFAWPSDSPTLLGSKCDECGNVTFPVESGCPKCSSESLITIPLATTGELWTWTSQEFRPKSPPFLGPEEFEPFFAGYVELAEGLRVETRLTGIEGRLPVIGEPMELAIVPFFVNENGDEIVTYTFRPTTVANETGSES